MFKLAPTLFPVVFVGSLASAQDTIKVLHYTETTGYDHNTRVESKILFENICAFLTTTTPYVWLVDDSDSSEVFDDLARLQSYHVVVWSNTSGANGLTANQRANYEQYVNGGGNYLGIHAASDTYRHSSSNGINTGVWDFYGEILAGCSIQENPHHTNADHNNNLSHSATHPILNGIPNPWNKTEEYYYWENGFLDSSFTELLQVAATGPNTYDAARMTAHYKEHAWGSRSFYTSLGHAASNFTTDANFEQLLKNALFWCASKNFTTEINTMSNGALAIYPNPFKHAITIQTKKNGLHTVVLYDTLGGVVYTGEVEMESTLDVSHLQKGVYYLVLSNQYHVYTTQMVKQ